MNNYKKIIQDLKKSANPKRAQISQKFFKTGQGDYGEGDVFIGINSSSQRQIAKKYFDLRLNDSQKLLNSKIHEHRMVGLLITVLQFEKGDEKKRQEIYNFFIKNSKKINNWDLVDVNVPRVIGAYLLDKPNQRKILYRFAGSKNLWERRISIIATYAFIRNKNFKETLKISEILLNDKHDLIHKAVGWMLREVGNRDRKTEEKFLKKYYQKMPRTMLRYAIEKFPEKLRKKYLKGKI